MCLKLKFTELMFFYTQIWDGELDFSERSENNQA